MCVQQTQVNLRNMYLYAWCVLKNKNISDLLSQKPRIYKNKSQSEKMAYAILNFVFMLHLNIHFVFVFQMKKTRSLTQYHYISWPDHGTPEPMSLLDFYHHVTTTANRSEVPTLVHCRLELLNLIQILTYYIKR